MSQTIESQEKIWPKLYVKITWPYESIFIREKSFPHVHKNPMRTKKSNTNVNE